MEWNVYERRQNIYKAEEIKQMESSLSKYNSRTTMDIESFQAYLKARFEVEQQLNVCLLWKSQSFVVFNDDGWSFGNKQLYEINFIKNVK